MEMVHVYHQILVKKLINIKGNCVINYSGLNCNKTNCFGIDADNNNVCNKNGKCTSFNKCNCDQGYFGIDCLFPVCYGIPDSSLLSCNGKLL
jgi:hypothetical protein